MGLRGPGPTPQRRSHTDGRSCPRNRPHPGPWPAPLRAGFYLTPRGGGPAGTPPPRAGGNSPREVTLPEGEVPRDPKTEVLLREGEIMDLFVSVCCETFDRSLLLTLLNHRQHAPCRARSISWTNGLIHVNSWGWNIIACQCGGGSNMPASGFMCG